MKTKLAIAAAAALLSASAFATPNVSGGEVTFNGTVLASSCTITVDGGENNGTVTLSPITVSEFKAADAVYKQADFTIKASQCVGLDNDAVKLSWTTGEGSNNTQYLANTQAGGAENVSVVILSDATPVVPGAGVKIDPTSSDAEAAVFEFKAGYAAPELSTAAPTPGAVVAKATYNIAYN